MLRKHKDKLKVNVTFCCSNGVRVYSCCDRCATESDRAPFRGTVDRRWMMFDDDFVDAGPCCQCKTRIKLPKALHDAARHSPEIWFYCAYGHRQHYTKTPAQTEADTLRRERDRLQQRLAQRDDEILYQRDRCKKTERRLSATRGQVTRLKNRAKAGVCPCCNRHFANLERHMAAKHPDSDNEAAFKVIEGGAA